MGRLGLQGGSHVFLGLRDGQLFELDRYEGLLKCLYTSQISVTKAGPWT